jgi:N,N'-diacetyllegionaminate synthase
MNHIKVIAEAGVNHNGDIQTALHMIDIAADAGANAIKFQTFSADKLVSKYADKAEYQKLTTGKDESQYEMLKKLQLSYNDHLKLFSYSQERGIEFISSPFDIESIDLLVSLGLQTFKIPSGEITNSPISEKNRRITETNNSLHRNGEYS